MPDQSFIGGMRTFIFNATWPLAGLTLSDDGLTLRLAGFAYTRRTWSEVGSVQPVIGGLLGSRGIRITFADGRRVVFWTFTIDAVLAAFREHGVRVIDSEGKLPKVWLGS
jgi:hypothetical protein